MSTIFKLETYLNDNGDEIVEATSGDKKMYFAVITMMTKYGIITDRIPIADTTDLQSAFGKIPETIAAFKKAAEAEKNRQKLSVPPIQNNGGLVLP